MSKRLNYVDGVNVATLKKIATFWFGTLVIDTKINHARQEFVIIVDDKTEEWQIKQFVNFWKVKIVRVS